MPSDPGGDHPATGTTRADNPSTDGPRARQLKYEARVSEAIEQHRFWDMCWAELARDYNSAVANVLYLWRQVDTSFRSDSHTVQ